MVEVTCQEPSNIFFSVVEQCNVEISCNCLNEFLVCTNFWYQAFQSNTGCQVDLPRKATIMYGAGITVSEQQLKVPFTHLLCQYQAVLCAPGIFGPWIALCPGWVPLMTLSEVPVQLWSGSCDFQEHREDPSTLTLLLSERDQFVVTHWGPRLESLSEAEGTAGTMWR